MSEPPPQPAATHAAVSTGSYRVPAGPIQAPSGHIFRAERKRGPVWYVKYRLPDGRQRQRKLGPAWAERGRPPAGCFTKRLAEDALRQILGEMRDGTLPGMVRTGATFDDAASEFLRYAEHDRVLKPSTVRGYRSIVDAYLLPAFGRMPLEEITHAHVERFRRALTSAARERQRVREQQREREGRRGRGGDSQAASGAATEPTAAEPPPLANATKNRIVTLLHGIFARACKVYGLPANPVSGIERHPIKLTGDIEVFSPEEVWALVRATEPEQDGAIFLTAAFTGLRRGELLALRWRDVDFTGAVIRVRASYAGGALTSPKSGKVRSVPMAPDVAERLARLRQREHLTGEDELVFTGEAGGYVDASALRRRYVDALGRAGLRPLRFHDLRHTFGTRMIAKADIRRVQEWMGHADIQTTMRYLHYAPREEDARLVAEAFAVDGQGAGASSAPPAAATR